jgi:DNA polymerase-3 subunit beta
MKIICSTAKLNKTAQIAQKALPTKAVSPILTGFYLKALDGKLEIQATDYERSVVASMEAQVIEEGQVVCPGALFSNLAGRLSGDAVEISKTEGENKINISSGGYETDILTLPAEEYPSLVKLPVSNFVKIKDDTLRDLIKKTAFAAAADEARPVFTGVLIRIKGKELSFVATNTHRLAVRTYVSDTDGGDFSMIVPAKLLRDIERMNFSDLPEDVVMMWKSRKIALSIGNFYIDSNLIEGNFPDYQKLIGESFSKEAKVRVRDLLGAVDRVSIFFKSGEYNALRLNIDNNLMTITSNNPEIGKSREIIACENSGGPIEIAFNSRYISDILRNIEDENIIMRLNSSIGPACLKPENDDNYLYLVTPVRVAY